MDEKTDVLPSDQLPISDADTSAGIETDADLLPVVSASTDSVISTASTDTVISTDTLTDILTSTETATVSDKISSCEASPAEALAPIVPTDGLASDGVSVGDVITPMDVLESTEEVSENTKTCEDVIENKVSSPNNQMKSSSVCELEEELKRLHEGDPITQEETQDPQSEGISDETIEQDNPLTKESQKEKSLLDAATFNEQPPEKELDPVEMLTAADDASKDPVLIRNSQDDIKSIDVLVCGSCHEVFHFVEEFQAHKSGKCKGVSNILNVCEGETKQQVWGFTLWKNKQQKLGENIPSSWVIYQKWCKLPQIDKDAWISAGHRLQFCTQIGYAKITENKPKPAAAPQVKQVEKDPLALDGFADSNKENSIVSNKSGENQQNSSEVVKKNIVKPVRLNNDVTILPSIKNGDPNSNKAIRTVRSTEKREYVVERIVAKRFNPKRKTWEYQIKWENFPSEQNTWEPISNLNHCKQMVEEFEQQLKKLKAEKAKQQAATMSPKGRAKTIRMSPIISTPGSSYSDSTPGRPQRTSKQKALNQVKAWCGNISDADEGGVKRSFEDDDSDDSFEKKMKYEDYSDDSDEEMKPQKITQYKKIAPKPPTIQVIKNGVGKATPMPQNVLIPDANGVVRINQKQLPSLSTGVYIMSKTAGIIKLDSTSSKVATSGGQTIVKVAPKIGQTQIKIVKKDGTTTTTKQIIQMSPNKPSPQTTPTKMYKPVITKVKKPAEVVPSKAAATKIIVKPKEKEEPPKKEPPATEDSDDGLEELPFPSDLPLPEPESPPSEFILDPFTGKIAGQEYPEPEPEPEPEAEPEPEKNESDDTSLENIVKLAAADITEDDLKSGSVETPMETEPIQSEPEEATPVAKKTESVTPVKSSTSSTPVKVTMTPTLVKSEPSILNRALNNSAILRKSLLNASSQPKVQQRILNQSIASRTHNVSSLVRTVPRGSNVVRTRPIAPRPKFNIAGHSNVIRSQHETTPKNVYSKSTVSSTRKIGNTTIRSAAAFTGHRPQARIVQTSPSVQKASPKKESLLFRTQVAEKTVTPPKPKTVISMPSLIGDDEPSLSPPSSEPSKSPTLPATTTTTPVVTPATTTEAPTETAAQPAGDAAIADISSFTLADNENPIFITGDDGTVYQVAGQNEQGQTILLTQGSDGQQQCLLVTNEVAEAMETTTEEQPQAEIAMPEIPADVTEPLSVKTDDASDQVVAQVVRAEPPSPGGTHKVVVMLPDGNLMVTQVSPEEYASLELE